MVWWENWKEIWITASVTFSIWSCKLTRATNLPQAHQCPSCMLVWRKCLKHLNCSPWGKKPKTLKGSTFQTKTWNNFPSRYKDFQRSTKMIQLYLIRLIHAQEPRWTITCHRLLTRVRLTRVRLTRVSLKKPRSHKYTESNTNQSLLPEITLLPAPEQTQPSFLFLGGSWFTVQIISGVFFFG